MEHRLAAILATDVVGYSRLIRADEAGTLTALKAHRSEFIDPKFAEHKGPTRVGFVRDVTGRSVGRAH